MRDSQMLLKYWFRTLSILKVSQEFAAVQVLCIVSKLYWTCSLHFVCFSITCFQMVAPFGFPLRFYCQVFDLFS